MFDMPFVRVECLGDSNVAITAAQIQLQSQLSNEALASLDAAQQMDEYLGQIRLALQRLCGSLALTSLTLRYIYVPRIDTRRPQFHIVCLLRADGENEHQARQRARECWDEFVSVFPRRLYTLLPITDEQLLEAVYLPIDPHEAEIVEIRKSEEIIPTKYIAAGEYFYSVHSVRSAYTPIEDVLELIARQQNLFIVDVCLSPTRLTNDEDYIIRQIIGQLHKFATGFSVQLHSGITVFEPDLNAELCLNRYISTLENSECIFQHRIQIISSRPIPLHLLVSVATALNQNHSLEFASGQYEAEAKWTYKYLDPFLIWGGSPVWDREDAPHSIRRLSYLVSPSTTTLL